MSLDELQTAVLNLSANEFAKFSRWFEEYLDERWDREIEADVWAGRLDAAGRRADDDFEAGRCSAGP